MEKKSWGEWETGMRAGARNGRMRIFTGGPARGARVGRVSCGRTKIGFLSRFLTTMSVLYDIQSCVTLNDGHSFPRLGLGVYETEPGAQTYDAVTFALEAGYRQSTMSPLIPCDSVLAY